MSWVATGITAAVSVISAGVQIYSQQQAAEAQEDAAFANNLAAQAEARNRELEAAEAIRRQRARDRQERAAIRARLANTGTLTTSGTPLAILGETAANQNLALQDAVRSANVQAASIRSEGKMGLWEASQASAAADIASVASAVQAVGTTAGTYVRTRPNP